MFMASRVIQLFVYFRMRYAYWMLWFPERVLRVLSLTKLTMNAKESHHYECGKWCISLWKLTLFSVGKHSETPF